ncbi:antitoxin (DNA-binding transcriptional repressor) of toxin-antitoxin stability system [Streptacidiphilus sp. EB103A]
MITMTATEAGRSFSAVLDLASEGETISITRGGELVATIVPPVRSNGAAIIAAYADHRPDPAFADDLETAHRDLNLPEEVRDPWDEG